MTLGARRALLAAVLDTLVPPSGEFPGAGAVALDHVLAIAVASPQLESLVSRCLDAAETAARARGAAGFPALAPDDREAVLRRVEAAEPECVDALVRHTYDGYYSDATVIARLGLDPRPPHPRGHRVESVALDLTRVSARGSIYRPA